MTAPTISMKSKVKILVTVPNPEHLNACTLVFDTLRVGFPTAQITVDINPSTDVQADTSWATAQKAIAAGCSWRLLSKKVHHADWIRQQVERHDSESPLIILDADTVFWKSCEDWVFPSDTLLAGYYVPRIWNDFAKCVSFPRLHTSLLWMPNTAALRCRIAAAYPPALEAHGEYCPCDPYMPAVRFEKGKPYFWDTCANLYNMLPPSEVAHFTPERLECYDHLNSASFYDVMLDRLHGDKEGFAYLHRFGTLPGRPNVLRNLWPHVDAYYAERALQARLEERSFV